MERVGRPTVGSSFQKNQAWMIGEKIRSVCTTSRSWSSRGNRDNTMVMLREEGEITDGATCSQRLTDLQEKKKEDISRELRRSASEEARSYVQEEITAEEVEE